MADSLAKGERIRLDNVSTIADGIAVKEPGTLTYEACRLFVDEVVTVTEDEIAAAILALIEKQKLVSEGAGAVSVAAAMFHKLPIEHKKVVCIVSGGNIDVTILNRVITRGLTKSGRICNLTLVLNDKPGQLSGVCEVIGKAGGNILSVTHGRSNAKSGGINNCEIHIELETRNPEHVKEINEALTKAGYIVLD